MKAEAILEAVKALANKCFNLANEHADYERGERNVALKVLMLIKKLERKEDEG